MRRVFGILLASLGLMFLATACGGAQPAVGSPSAPTVEAGPGASAAAGSGSEIVILSQTAFLDRWGRLHIVGEIRNDSAQPLTGIELEVEITDAGGNSLLVDSSGSRVPALRFAPMLVTLAPGEAAPFAYAYDMRLGTPDAYHVSVAAYRAGAAERPNLTVERLTLTDDGRGMLYLTGEILNVGGEWARIHALAGGVLDADGVLLSAEWTPVFMTLLAPAGDIGGRDRTPFVIQLPHPGASARTPTLYVDADLAAPPPDLPVAVDNTNAYFDRYGAYHIVGALINQTTQPLDLVLVAGLYAADGTVLDAAAQPLPVTLEPGERLPFELSTFTSLEFNPALAARLMSHAVRVDPGRAVSPAAIPLRLATRDDRLAQEGNTLVVRGMAVNVSAVPLGRITVLATLVDEAGAPLASGYAYVFPRPGAGSIGPDETLPYEIRIELAPGLDVGRLQIITFAQGTGGQ